MVRFEDLTTADRTSERRPLHTNGRMEARVVAAPPAAALPLEELELRGAVTRSMELDGVVFVHQRLHEPSPGIPPAALLQHFLAETGTWDPIRSERASEGLEVILIEHLEGGAASDADASELQRLARESLDFVRELGLAELDLLGFSFVGRPQEDVVLLSPRLVRRLVAASQRARRPTTNPVSSAVISTGVEP